MDSRRGASVNRNFSLFYTALAAITLACLVPGHSKASSPITQDGIRIEGFGSVSTSATQLEVVFELPIGAASFEDSINAAEAMRQRIFEVLSTEGFSPLEVSLDLSLFRQKAIAWRKGKKIEHRFIANASELAPGELLAKSARLLDLVLPLDQELTVASLRSAASQEAIQLALEKAIAVATDDAIRRAQLIAREAGVTLGQLKYITHTHTPEYASSLYDLEALVVLGANFRDPFRVTANLATEIKVATGILAVYSIEP